MRQRVARARLPGPRGVVAQSRLARQLTSDPCPGLDEGARLYGPTFAIGAGPLRLVVVGDPAHLTTLFATSSDQFRWAHYANVLGFILGSTSIVTSDGDEHARRRGAVQPAFARRRLEAWIPMIVAETDRTIDGDLGASTTPLDAYPIGKDLVFRIVIEAFFGGGLAKRMSEIEGIFELLQGYIELPAAKQLPHRLPGTRRARVRAARVQFGQLVTEEIAARRRRPLDEESADLLDVLLNEQPPRLSDQEIEDQMATLIGAGYHTTAASLAWTLQRALSTPDVWSRLRAEADAAFDANTVRSGEPGAGDAGADDAPSVETLRALPYASAVVHEVLRLHPAGVFAPRQAVGDITLGPMVVPKGALILWSPYLAGRGEAYWPDPLEFRPERHLDADAASATAKAGAWAPFGRGPHACIGFALAEMELTLILARVAQRCDLTLVSATTPRPHGMVVSRPEGGVPVTIT